MSTPEVVLASSQWINDTFPFFNEIGKTLADWFSWIKIGAWFQSLVDWMTANLDPFFSFVSDVIGWCVDSLTAVFLWLPALIFALMDTVIPFAIALEIGRASVRGAAREAAAPAVATPVGSAT